MNHKFEVCDDYILSIVGVASSPRDRATSVELSSMKQKQQPIEIEPILIVQTIRSYWTKASRGAPGSIARNTVPGGRIPNSS
jgi:hypothetical protein